jgi:hypothetical protein
VAYVPHGDEQGDDMTTSRTPRGLSAGSRGVWRTLIARYECVEHELITLERALKWFDRSDALLREADALTGQARAATLKQSMDASTVALRHWRLLKFRDELSRRPGRPSGDDWSPKRKLLAAAARAAR